MAKIRISYCPKCGKAHKEIGVLEMFYLVLQDGNCVGTIVADMTYCPIRKLKYFTDEQCRKLQEELYEYIKYTPFAALMANGNCFMLVSA